MDWSLIVVQHILRNDSLFQNKMWQSECYKYSDKFGWLKVSLKIVRKFKTNRGWRPNRELTIILNTLKKHHSLFSEWNSK